MYPDPSDPSPTSGLPPANAAAPLPPLDGFLRTLGELSLLWLPELAELEETERVVGVSGGEEPGDLG